MSSSTAFGRNLAFVIGGGLLATAGIVVVAGGDRIVAVILTLVGASALAGALKRR